MFVAKGAFAATYQFAQIRIGRIGEFNPNYNRRPCALL